MERLSNACKARMDREDRSDLSPREARFTCYDQVRRELGHTTKGVRVQLPACIVALIREGEPNPDGIAFTGFKPSRHA